MDRIVSAAEANRSFSVLLREVEAGSTVAVAKHGRVVARMIPAESAKHSEEERNRRFREFLDELRHRPLLDMGPITRDDGYA